MFFNRPISWLDVFTSFYSLFIYIHIQFLFNIVYGTSVEHSLFLLNSLNLMKNRWWYFELIWTKLNAYLNSHWVQIANIKSTCPENIRHTATPDAEVGSSLNHPSLTESHLFTRHFWKLLGGKQCVYAFWRYSGDAINLKKQWSS